MAVSRIVSPGLPKAARHAWLVAILACVALFLFTDKAQDTECIHNVFVYDVAVLPHNCDALSMADKLLDFESFYVTYHNWKGRPVYHAYGAIAGSALVPVAYPIWAALYPGVKTKNQLKKFSASFNFHLAYFLLNIGVVIACAWVAIRVSGLETASWPAVALAAAIASTDLVEGGVWLLHTNIFNLVSAFGTLLFIVLGMQRTILTREAVLWGGFLIGLGVLIYPAIAVVAPGYVAGRLLGRLKVANDRASLGSEFVELVLFALMAVLPVVAWWAANRYLFETSTYLTADKGHFSWAAQAWAESDTVARVLTRLGGFYAIVMKFSAAEYLLALGAIAVLALRNGAQGVRSLIADPVVWAVLIAMAGVLGFNFLQGYHAARLHVAAAYLLYVVIARLARTPQTEALGALCLFGIAGYQIVNAMMTYSVSGD